MKFLIVDDHALIRDAMRSVLLALRADAQVLEASGAAQALSIAASGVDLVLLDLQLADGDGFEVLAELRRRHPATAVVMLSARDDRATMLRALSDGAVGFVPKTETRDVLVGALALVLAGGVYVPSRVIAEDAPLQAGTPGDEPGSAPLDALGLTERQREVLALMMQGKSNKLIGRALSLAEPTVKNHVSAILRALDVQSRTEAVLRVSRSGWVPPPTAAK